MKRFDLMQNKWLNFFVRDSKTIRKHINSALQEELNRSTVAKFATIQKEGTREVTRQIEYYNLDVIISVGYRVKSLQGVTFRKWATNVLKDYMLKGYVVNQKRLEYLEKAVKLIDIATKSNETNDENIKEVLKVINNYSKGLDILDNYDHRNFERIKGRKSNKMITYQNCLDLIDLLKFNENSDIFALERDKGLNSIINNIYQSFDGNDVYPTIEEKAANFLYLVIKNHAFIDGNKRIAATLFIYFLHFYNILTVDAKNIIDNNTLAALTILIAESNPKEKNIMIDLIINILTN